MGAASPPTAVLRSAVPPPARGAGARGPIPRAPPEGPGEVGERRRESGGLEGSGEGGGQNKTQRGEQSTDVGKRQGAIQRELGGRETRVASFAPDEGNFQKNLLPLPLGRLTFF